jgi:GTP-binding protein HflX
LSIERAILVGVEWKRRPRTAGADVLAAPAQESLSELADLAASAGAEVAERILQVRDAPEAATLIGAGKVEEVAQLRRFHDAELVIFDAELTPTQLRNLEKGLGGRVIDRTQLILDIFASRARTREGQLQVELAQLNYLLPRLTGRGAAMSRLGGGIGTRGPGETQLETDRRKIARRIKKITEDLSHVRAGRTIQRRQRQGVPLATVSLVGYTNAGKSTLFNRLTGAVVTADARMFATLDPTVRHHTLPSRRRVLFSDTVGFIRGLPTTLVEAFRATLEEVVEARLLLHVVDASSPQAPDLMRHVLRVLEEIDAAGTTQLLVLNKMDRIAEQDRAPLFQRLIGLHLDHAPAEAVMVSAHTGEGLDALVARVDAMLPLDPIARVTFRIPAGDGAALHLVHECARILAQAYEEDVCVMDVEAPESLRRQLRQYLP